MNIAELYALYRRLGALTTDSRHCPAGSLFWALRGASFNGNRFAAQALAAGCAYAVVDEPDVVPAGDERYLLVPDALLALKHLARYHRLRFALPLVGITGTNGKTTTKELLAAVLQKKYRVLCTEGNFNNDVGVPKTLLRLNAEHQVAVVEMGASHPGDIKTLVETACPTCGLITNVGRAHLQGFGSFDGVKRTKGELYDYLKAHEGLAFVNADSDDLLQMASERGLTHVERYGRPERGATLAEGEALGCRPFLTFRWRRVGSPEWRTVRTKLIGAYNLDNLLAAISVGLHFGVEPALIDQALATYEPSNNRSELVQTRRNRLIVDAYNANPTSMAAAIDNFEQLEGRHKMAILGDMRELGADSAAEHRRVVDRLAQCHFDEVWLVGPEFGRTPCPYRKFADAEAVRRALSEQPIAGRDILIKGSNGLKLYTLTDLL